MTITLNPELASYIEGRVRAGAFSSADDAVNRMLAFVVKGEPIEQKELDRLRAEVAIGVAEAQRGELEEWDLRNSGSAAKVKSRLGAQVVTEEEFRRLFREQRTIDQRNGTYPN